MLEGTLNLAQEFGSLPDAIYVAVGAYQSADSGALVPTQQVPASVNGNGNIDVLEYYLLQLVAAPGDYNGNGNVDVADYILWKETYGQSEDLRADGNRDGVVDAVDYTVWRNQAQADAGSGGLVRYLLTPVDRADLAAVPEPASALWSLFALAIIRLRNPRQLFPQN